MAERTEQAPLVVDKFDGINTVVDELKLAENLTPWATGGFFDERSFFERIKGKKYHPISSGGHVLTITELQFTDKSMVFVHQKDKMYVEDDVSDLLDEPEIPTPLPTEPFIST